LTVETKRGAYPVVRVRTDAPVLPVVAIGDTHCGSRHFNAAGLDAVIKWVTTRQAAWFGIGDLMECATKASVGSGVYEQVLSPQKQIDYLIEKLSPIATQCFGMIKGNHEERAYKTTGIDPMQIICNAIGVPYLEWEMFAILSAERPSESCAYTLYACHSYSSSKTAGLALTWTEREMAYMGADILMRAHSHDLGFDPSDGIEIDPGHFCVRANRRYSVMTGHYLNRANSYIAARGARPKPMGTVALHLSMDKDARKIEPEYLLL
jgi:hypothetical protein